MSLRPLLDENISPVVADQVRRHRPDLVIESVHRWRDGELMNQKDERLLLAAAAEEWTLVTYDQKTIPGILRGLHEKGLHHSGVIFVDERTIPNQNFGLLTRSIISFWERHQDIEWRDCALFLNTPPE
jgi:hypothetical protein